jgi:hypothetical protein
LGFGGEEGGGEEREAYGTTMNGWITPWAAEDMLANWLLNLAPARPKYGRLQMKYKSTAEIVLFYCRKDGRRRGGGEGTE